MKTLIIALILLSGCGDGIMRPDPKSQEQAMHLVWEQVYGMDIDSRPTITWLSECDHGHIFGFMLDNLCESSAAFKSGEIELRWEGSFALTLFARTLMHERHYILSNKTDIFGLTYEDGTNILLANQLLAWQGL